MAQLQQRNGFWVADWWVQPGLSEIERDGTVIQLEPKVMAVLELLASQPGEVFSRQQLEDSVWQGTIVGYDALAKAINKLRDSLGDDKKKPLYVQTISKKGYRLIAPVTTDNSKTELSVGKNLEENEITAVGATRKVSYSKILIAGVFLLLLIVSGAVYFQIPGVTSEQQPIRQVTIATSKPTIVVLPFRNISPDDQNNYLADGLTSDLTTNLSKQSSLWVTASSAVLVYKNTEMTPEKIRQEFNARYMLSGEVNRIMQAIRVNVHLTDLENGNILWSNQYDRQFTDLFAVLDEVTNNILNSLSITVTEKEKQRIAVRYTSNLEAYDYFLRGQSLINTRTPEDNASAREMYNKAIELDPVFARAYAGLAMTYVIGHVNLWSSNAANPLQKALNYSNHAISLDKELPESYFVAGYVHGYRGHTSEAISNLEFALSLNPNYADVYAMMAFVYGSINRPQLALDNMSRAMQLNPKGGYLYLTQIGKANYMLGNYELALTNFQKAYERNPTYVPTLYYLAATYVNLQRNEEASWMINEARHTNPNLDIDSWLKLTAIRSKEFKSKLRRDLKIAESYYQQ